MNVTDIEDITAIKDITVLKTTRDINVTQETGLGKKKQRYTYYRGKKERLNEVQVTQIVGILWFLLLLGLNPMRPL
jgi:hypothetical protein